MQGDIVLEKQQLRQALLAQRESWHPTAGGAAGLAIAAQDLPPSLLGFPKIVSGFHPYRGEIDTRPLLGSLAARGWATCLPVVKAKAQPLIFRRWNEGDALITAGFGLQIPAETAEELRPDVLLVPLLGFDRRGFRLGYGGGFYDRTLQLLRSEKPVTAIGLAFAAQEVEAVPHDGFDQRLDFVMTEQECFTCG